MTRVATGEGEGGDGRGFGKSPGKRAPVDPVSACGHTREFGGPDQLDAAMDALIVWLGFQALGSSFSKMPHSNFDYMTTYTCRSREEGHDHMTRTSC